MMTMVFTPTASVLLSDAVGNTVAEKELLRAIRIIGRIPDEDIYMVQGKDRGGGTRFVAVLPWPSDPRAFSMIRGYQTLTESLKDPTTREVVDEVTRATKRIARRYFLYSAVSGVVANQHGTLALFFGIFRRAQNSMFWLRES